jgi:hypothetical protein
MPIAQGHRSTDQAIIFALFWNGVGKFVSPSQKTQQKTNFENSFDRRQRLSKVSG